MRKVFITTVSCMLAINYLTAQELRMQPVKFQDATIREDPSNPGRLKIDKTGNSHVNELPPLETEFLGSLTKDLTQLFTNNRNERLHQPQNTETDPSRPINGGSVPATNFQDVNLGHEINGGIVPVTNLREQKPGQPITDGMVPKTNLQDMNINQRLDGGDVSGGNVRNREPVQTIHNKIVPVTNLRDVQLKDIGDNQTEAIETKEPSASTGSVPLREYQELSSYRSRGRGSRPTNRRQNDAARNNQWSNINHNRHAQADRWTSSDRHPIRAVDGSTHHRLRTPMISNSKWSQFPSHHNRHDMISKKYFPQNIRQKAYIQKPFLGPHRHYLFG